MEQRVYDLFDNMNCPVVITDNSDIVTYKNPLAKRNIPLPRRGSSIALHIDPRGVNIIDEATENAAFHTFSGLSLSYKHALAFTVPNKTGHETIWLFDFTFQMVKRETARTFLFNAARTIKPFVDDITSGRIGKKEMSEESWSNAFYKLVKFLSGCLKDLYFTNETTVCADTTLIEFLRNEAIEKLGMLGIRGESHQIISDRRRGYIDYYRYTVIFIRILLFMIGRNNANSFKVDFIKEEDILRTRIEFGCRLSDPSTRFGKFKDLHDVFPNDRLNLAVIEALLSSERGYELNYEIRKGAPRNVILTFDAPLKVPAAATLHQTPDFVAVPAFMEFRTIIADLFASLR